MKLEEAMEIAADLGPLELHDMELAAIVTKTKTPSISVADCRSSGCDDAQNQANAALLAHWYNAGPKLLEALKGANSALQHHEHYADAILPAAIIQEAEEVEGI